MTQTGWRKPTPDLGRVHTLSQDGEQETVPKGQAFQAVKRVGVHLGLKASDIMLLDTLGAFSQTQDWEPGQRPLVWPSNATLMAQTGFSLSALKRHLRRLAKAGVIAFRDSPNGKRWGRRRADGSIAEAYGLDLSPLAARATEFTALDQEIRQERALVDRLRRQITVARRTIRAILDDLQDQLDHDILENTQCRFSALLGALTKVPKTSNTLASLLTQFEALRDHIIQAVTPSRETNLLAPKETENDPHTPTTKELKEESNEASPTPISLKTVLAACPELRSWATTLGPPIENWPDLCDLAEKVHRMLGIQTETWGKAIRTMGMAQAAAALALILEKHTAGVVVSPDRYLAGLTRRACSGTLHLMRSFHGLLKGTTNPRDPTFA